MKPRFLKSVLSASLALCLGLSGMISLQGTKPANALDSGAALQASAPGYTPMTRDEILALYKDYPNIQQKINTIEDAPRQVSFDIGGGAQMLITRKYTGTGHGIAGAQCGITSSNAGLFPEGEAVHDRRVDDSPEDPYVCWRDQVAYQIEFNFGPSPSNEAHEISFNLQINDQAGVVKRAYPDRYGFTYDTSAGDPSKGTRSAADLCNAPAGGIYSGTSTIHNYVNNPTLACTLRFEPGVSGTVVLPELRLISMQNAYPVAYVQPTITLNGAKSNLPGFEVLTQVMSDTILKPQNASSIQNGSYRPIVYVHNGVPGVILGVNRDKTGNSFDAKVYSQWNGIDNWDSSVFKYTIGSYQLNDGADVFRPLPESAVVMTTLGAGNTYVDSNGQQITPVKYSGATEGWSVGVWIPADEYQKNGGFGMKAKIDATRVYSESGSSNYNRLDAWDPGTGEKCSFSTASLGLTNVFDGKQYPNNNCAHVYSTFGAHTWGTYTKLVDGTTRDDRLHVPESVLPVTLQRSAQFSSTGDIALCDVWDAKDDKAPRSTYQSIIANTVKVTTNISGTTLELPNDIWNAKFGASDIAVSGDNLQTKVEDRCGGSTNWLDSPSGQETSINTLRVVVDRKVLQAFAEKTASNLRRATTQRSR